MNTVIDWSNHSELNAKRANGGKSCPNCGAPISSERCEYCGAVFVDMACMSTDEPFFLKIKRGGEILIVKVILQDATLTSEVEHLCCDTISEPYRRSVPYYCNETLEMNFAVIH